MGCSLQWRVRLLLCLGLFLHCGEARVNTETPTGPLYRVEDSPLSISCNVSGFKNADIKKHFEIRFKRNANSGVANIISSNDPSFGYASYQRRVDSGNITLEHVSANSVLFEIKRLQKSDEGEYDCGVINPEYIYDGTYSAFTAVKVIDNSLSVLSPASTSRSYNEGNTFTSTCQASSNTIQHTHLSLAWYLHKDGEDDAQPIISLDRYFTLSPGPGFQGRYQAGLIQLDKIGEATYRLEMAQLKLSDRGRVFCRAQEWIQEPDRSWYSIAQKDTDETTLRVTARVVVPDTSSLVVRISAQSTTLQVGQKLSITCNINAQNLEDGFFSVAWLRGGVELARIGPTGVLSVGHEYSVREGELRAARISDNDFHVRLQPVRAEDQGEYFCRAWPQKRGQDGAFIQGAAQDSNSQRVMISATESGLSLQTLNDTSIKEGDGLKLTCKVNGYKGQLSVNWQRKSTATPAAIFTNFISLSQEGVTGKVEEFESRKVKATRPAIDTFTLEMDEVTPEDAGVYQCVVSEWENNRKTNSRSETATVTVTPAESFVKVDLSSRNSVVTVGENVMLMCRVRGVHVPVTVAWSLQRDASIDNILMVYSSGAISWSGEQQHRYQLKIDKSETDLIHYLLINAASHGEAGRYQCSMSHNAHKRPTQSNPLAVQVLDPESKLILTSPPPMTVNIDTDVEMKCSVKSEPSASSRYSVTWQVEREAEKKTIVSSDRDAQVTFGSQLEPSDRQRISLRRTEGPSFELSIRQAWISDNGMYSCEVAEWIQRPQGDWYELSKMSTTTNLTVIELEKNLSILKKEAELNVSSSEDFTIPCQITKQSSNESEFQVTWFWQNQTAIFTSYRNATLQDRLGKGDRLRFSHPLPAQFILTVLKPGPEDSGLYSCEVEEWIHSLTHGWRKLAAEKSGFMTVNVNAEGDARRISECNSGTWIGILVAFIICALLVIFLLVLKICRGEVSGGKKSGQSLWAEQHPLNTKPSAED